MKLASTIVNIVLLAGCCVLLILTVAGGSSNHFPFNEFYWLRADTSNIRHAPNLSAWTFWGVCEYRDFSSCTLGPAYPISPVDNFSTEQNVPKDFVDNEKTYYYLTRFSFGFTFVGLCFAGIALLIDLLGLCFEIVDKVVMVFVTLALIFVGGTAGMQTAAAVMARNAFQGDDLKAHVGVKAFGILWGSVGCLIIIFFNTCFGNISNSYRKHITKVQETKDEHYVPPQGDNDASSFTRNVEEPKEENNGGIRFFKIKRNNKVSDEESV
ncbi:protein Sur7p [[Candida] jaroonii]|uniref:Protein Sur7p n=1 Tax=[Candida] jaroonii TaxID=467808 RepID=A0ACA9Y113_9ASCO|nr:protein Sur7p [[Candida] jaroonii]